MAIGTFQIPITSLLIIIFCLLVLSGFFSAIEIALFSFRKTRLAILVKQRNKRAILIEHIMKEPEKLLGTILVGNNIVAILISVLGTTVSLVLWGEKGVWVAFVSITFLLVMFGEIIPKVFASQFWESFTFACIRPISIIIWLLYPIVMIFSFFSNIFFHLFGIRIEYKKPFITKDELKHIVDMAKDTGHLKKDEVTLLEKVFAFHDRMAKEVMVPKSKIITLDINLPQDEMLKIITKGHFTRIPIYEGNPDNIIGILHTKEFVNIAFYKDLIVIQDLLRKPYFVLEEKKISEILRELQRQHLHLAVVKNAQDKVIGIITIEDILEEIVGEIMDEYEIPPRPK